MEEETAVEAIVYGTVCLDRFLLVDESGDAREGANWIEYPGGEALNTATALSGFGVRVAIVGTAIGEGDESDRLRTLLDTHPLCEGLSRRWIPNDPRAVTPVCEIRVFPDGERKMRGRGFKDAIAPEFLEATDAGWELLREASLFIVDPNLGGAARAATRAAFASGCRILSMDFEGDSEILSLSAVAIASRERSGPDVFATLTRMLEAGATVAMVTCGADGVVVRDERGESRFGAFPCGGIVDTTGAGDVFRAGVAIGLLRGWSVDRIVTFASARASLHCGVLGGGSRVAEKIISALCQNRPSQPL